MGASRAKNALASGVKNLVAFAFLVPFFYFIGWFIYNGFPTGFRTLPLCIEPLLVPPPPKERAGTDIAFAASCLDHSPDILLYYSLEDRVLRRAVVRELRSV